MRCEGCDPEKLMCGSGRRTVGSVACLGFQTGWPAWGHGSSAASPPIRP